MSESTWGFMGCRSLNSFRFVSPKMAIAGGMPCPRCGIRLFSAPKKLGQQLPALGRHFYCHVGQTKSTTKNRKNLINFTATTTNYFHYSGGDGRRCSFRCLGRPKKEPTTMADKNRAGRTESSGVVDWGC